MKTRVLIITDISSLTAGTREPDDAESLIRFLHYANEFDVEGLVASAYGESGPHPEYIYTILDAYEKELAVLRRFDPAYPSAEYLRNVTARGLERDEVGAEMSDGAQHVLSALRKPDPRPLWVLLWGGCADLAQALFTDKAAPHINRLRVYAIGDQYNGYGAVIRERYPDIFWITDYVSFRGMYRFGDGSLTGAEWVNCNIKTCGTPLTDIYPVYDGGDPWGNVTGIKEGDTPSFLYLIPGHRPDTDDPETEGWGGRFYRIQNNQFADVKPGETVTPALIRARAGSVYRWRGEYQTDFADRAKRGKIY